MHTTRLRVQLLNTYVQGQLANRSIEAANRILDTEFKLDVTEAKGVTDTVTAEETIEKRRGCSCR